MTNAEYARFIAEGGYANELWWTSNGWQWRQVEGRTAPRYSHDHDLNRPAQPVVGVSWWEAAAYCTWLTMHGHTHGWLPADQDIRLPTSLEWERAARHTDQRPYPWGWDEPTPEHANYRASGIGRPSPVGCFPTGAAVCGAQDMVGNVLEWLATPTHPRDQIDATSTFTRHAGVVLAPSTYWNGPSALWCGTRNGDTPGSRYHDQGFRVVQSLRSSI
ncbi:MAG: formylglycine-generating enzyme family protein [Chloroflexaceae bacterium]|nr:formylglycine-generating enzyme family protein [Chloroflexaceae bacterium]